MKYFVAKIDYDYYVANRNNSTAPISRDAWVEQQGSDAVVIARQQVDDAAEHSISMGVVSEVTVDEFEKAGEIFSARSKAELSSGQSDVTVEQTPKNQAWAALRDNADLNGSWPELKTALNKAVDSLGEDATAVEIYDKSIELLD